jgi:hypothetical protein
VQSRARQPIDRFLAVLIDAAVLRIADAEIVLRECISLLGGISEQLPD